MRVRAIVIGLGNVLCGDDALGPWALAHLEAAFALPPEVGVLDAGTPGLDLSVYLGGIELAVLVDTVRADGAPGELRRYDKAALLRRAPGPRTSPHDPGLHGTLVTLELAGAAPREVVLIGVIPGRTATGLGLSPEVAEAAPRAAAEVACQLARWGLAPVPREPTRPAAVWWERGGLCA